MDGEELPQRFRLGHGTMRLSSYLACGLVAAAALVAVFGVHMNALSIEAPAEHTGAFVLILFLLAAAAALWFSVRRRFTGWLTVDDAALRIELGGRTRVVPWDRIRTVAHDYRTIFHDERVSEVSTSGGSEDSGLLTVEATGSRRNASQAAIFSADPDTIVIEVEGASKPVVIAGAALYDPKRAFDTILQAVERKLVDRPGG
jgi:hypothetical protein